MACSPLRLQGVWVRGCVCMCACARALGGKKNTQVAHVATPQFSLEPLQGHVHD